MLGRFLLQLQVQMKTSLEVMNMNATYEIRSQHIVDFQKKVTIKVLLLQEKCKQCSSFAVKVNTKIWYWFLGKQDYFPFWDKILV